MIMQYTDSDFHPWTCVDWYHHQDEDEQDRGHQARLPALRQEI